MVGITRLTRKVINLSIVVLILGGCTSSTSLNSNPQYAQHIRGDHHLMEQMYLGRVNRNVSPGTIHIHYSVEDLHIMFSARMLNFMIENKVVLGEPEKIEIGRQLSIEAIDKYNWFEGTTMYAFGSTFSTRAKKNVPFQLNIQSSLRVELERVEQVSGLSGLVGVKEKRSYKKYLDSLPWEKNREISDRVIEEYERYY